MPGKNLSRQEIVNLLPQKGCLCLPRTFSTFNEIFAGEGIWKIRKNDFFLKRHFDCMPGSIIIEFIEQVAALLIMTEKEIKGNPIICRLDNPGPDFGRLKTVAGDTITGFVTMEKSKRGMYFLKGKVTNQHGKIILETGIVGAAEEEKKQLPSMAGKMLSLEDRDSAEYRGCPRS